MENENVRNFAALHDAGSAEEDTEAKQDTAPADMPEQNAAVQAVGAEAEQAVTTVPRRKTAGERFAGYFTATRIAYIAIFTALSYVLGLFDFSVIPAVAFLKVDFSNTFVMIAGFSLGPVAGTIVAVLKELLHAITFGQTAFVGELANILLVLPYMLIPAIAYRKHKGIKAVIITLILGCVAQCIVCIPVNWLLNFPAYLMAFTGTTWKEGMDYFWDLWYFALAFNAIKTVLVSVATLIIYKPLSKLIKLTAAKFDKAKARRKKNR
ncbi:MAG: ECF transporter S component [Clostridia bacterium]|nr:ECF transporter S component [Clostridia bacterium]